MADSDDTPLEPVEGTTFGPSARKGMLAVGGGLFLTLIPAVIVAWRFAATGDDRPSVFLTLGSLVLGVLGAFFIVLSIVMMMRKRRVVIGADRVQIVQEIVGVDVVMAQVMFANVAGLMPTEHEGGKEVRVRLADPEGAGTYNAIGAIRPRPSGEGFDFVIDDAYQGKTDELIEALDAAVLAWRREQPEEPRASFTARPEPPGA